LLVYKILKVVFVDKRLLLKFAEKAVGGNPVPAIGRNVGVNFHVQKRFNIHIAQLKVRFGQYFLETRCGER